MTRFTECAWSEVPFGFVHGTAVGTSASGGCNCVQALQYMEDPLLLEIDAIVEGRDTAAGRCASQP